MMSQNQINEVVYHKHLRVIFSNNCTWHSHIESIKSKSWKRINIMRKLKFQLDRKSLQTYFSFIRPLLEYADVVWNNCTQYESEDIEKIHNEAARIVTGATKLVSIEKLLLETGWETLESRRKKRKLILFYNLMQNNLSPNYLSSLVPPLLVVPCSILYEMHLIYKQYVQILSNITTHIYLLLSATGMNSHNKLVVLQA